MSSAKYKIAEEKAIELLKKNNITKPFVDVFEIAENEGIDIQYVGMPSNFRDVAGFYDPEQKAIFINNEEPANRQTFTVAHELGHHILKHEPEKLNVLLRRPLSGSNKSFIETEADVFAANLLVPEKMLRETMKVYRLSSEDTEILAKLFAVSKEMMRYRLKHISV